MLLGILGCWWVFLLHLAFRFQPIHKHNIVPILHLRAVNAYFLPAFLPTFLPPISFSHRVPLSKISSMHTQQYVMGPYVSAAAAAARPWTQHNNSSSFSPSHFHHPPLFFLFLTLRRRSANHTPTSRNRLWRENYMSTSGMIIKRKPFHFPLHLRCNPFFLLMILLHVRPMTTHKITQAGQADRQADNTYSAPSRLSIEP
jgi:hypothetical protein